MSSNWGVPPSTVDTRLVVAIALVRASCSVRVALVIVIALALFPPHAGAAEPTNPAHFTQLVRPYLTRHCVACHGAAKAEGELRLDTLEAEFSRRPAADQWVEVLNRLNLGEMPPQDEPRPDAEQSAQVVDWITAELRAARARELSTGGRTLLRRLTRQEYANTVRDLLAVEFPAGTGPLELLPPDGSLDGFDKASRTLLLDPSLLDAYLAVAEQVVDRALAFRPPVVPERTMRFEFEGTVDSPMSYILEERRATLDGEWLVLMESAARTYGKLRHPYSDSEIPLTGRYQVRVRAAADPGERGEPIFMDVSFGSVGRLARFRVDATPDEPRVYELERTFDAATPGEFEVSIVNGTRFREGNQEWYHDQNALNRLGERGDVLGATRIKARMRAAGAADSGVRGSYLPRVAELSRLPKLRLDWIEVQGPLQGEYPPPSMRRLFGERPAPLWTAPTAPRDEVLDEARRVLAPLATRAFRRPLGAGEVEALLRVVEDELDARSSPADSLRTALIALLCSPKFLLLFEPGSAGTDTASTTEQVTAPRPLNDHELATRLSYFLWSSLPDEALRARADRGELREPRALTEELLRMLDDPRAEGFVAGFARQWLRTEEFLRFPPDEQIYPQFYATELAGLADDVREEPLAFFRELLRGNEPVSRFLDSDWLMLNERLARLYGLDQVQGLHEVRGEELRRVTLPRAAATDAATRAAAPGWQRGGLLGMAGVHLWGADGSRTKPVERGKYVLTVLFNDPPPPPPPNAGEVEPNLGGQKLTVRERLARHREQVSCNNCHRRIDPFGMALENFNAIGQWRERLDGEKPLSHWGDDRPAIDPSATLPNGREFATFVEFKSQLVEQEGRFLRGLTEKLLLYALGRPMEPADQGLVEEIVRAARPDGPTLRSLLREVVLSRAFGEK